MPSDAAALIAQLREHPKVCAMFGIAIEPSIYGPPDEAVTVERGKFAFGGKSFDEPIRTFRRWLTGACVEKCDELGIVLDQEETEFRMWYWFNRNTLRSDQHAYDTRLGAALAALESHDA